MDSQIHINGYVYTFPSRKVVFQMLLRLPDETETIAFGKFSQRVYPSRISDAGRNSPREDDEPR